MKKCAKCVGWETCPRYKNGYCVPVKSKGKLYSAYIWRRVRYFDDPNKSYQYNASFCFNDFEALNRYFENDMYIIEGISISERISKKIIYRGHDYSEMLLAIKKYKGGK